MMNDLISRQAAIDEMAELQGRASTKAELNGISKMWKRIKQLPPVQPEPCEYAVSAIAVEEMLKDLLPERGMWEIEGDEAKTVICETIHDALNGLWKLPFVKPDSKELSSTHKALDTISRQAAIDAVKKLAYPDGYIDEPFEHVTDALRVLPSAQPEIIYCGDCKYKDDGIDEDGIPFLKCLSGRSYGGTRINDFCSWAERKEDG